MAGTTNNDAQQLRQGPPGPGKRSGYFLAVIQSLSITYCLAAALVSVFMLVVLLNSAFGGGAPGITLPVGASGGTAVPALQTGTEIADAHFTEVVFSAWGLSPLAALLYYAPNVLVPVAHALIAWSVYKLAVAAGTPRPFGPPARRALVLCAVTSAVMGTVIQLLHGLGTSLARSELLAGTDLSSGVVPAAPFNWSPLFIGLAILILVLIFNAGEKFQKEISEPA